jgi:hypothetical protein
MRVFDVDTRSLTSGANATLGRPAVVDVNDTLMAKIVFGPSGEVQLTAVAMNAYRFVKSRLSCWNMNPTALYPSSTKSTRVLANSTTGTDCPLAARHFEWDSLRNSDLVDRF